MPSYKAYLIDAFTNVKFAGNQAAICLIPQKLSDKEYQKIAAEFNLSETAYPLPLDTENYETATKFSLRWFTPTVEVALCGHATLATSHVIFNEIGNKNPEITFETLSGDLIVRKHNDQLVMNFPQYKKWISYESDKIQNGSLNLYENRPKESFIDKIVELMTPPGKCRYIALAVEARKLLLVLDEKTTKSELLSLPHHSNELLLAHDGSVVRGVVVTLSPKDPKSQGFIDANGKSFDYVSRYFAPWAGINEDPATGSAQCALGPFWSKAKQSKGPFYAFQCYPGRGAQFTIEFPNEERVDIYGNALTVLRGHIEL
jgi:predicted PhzF superfamily epimerase YddE/YHI9